MSKLMDIKGYWNESNNYEFNDKNVWEGKILLEEDGWFEGLVVNPNSSYLEDRFIFGIYYPEKVIELFKFVPTKISAPFIYHGKRDAKGYDGKLETIGLFETTQYGVSHIITQYAENNRKNIEKEKQELETSIEKYKQNTLDRIGRDFYNNLFATREKLGEIVLRNYQGRNFEIEEIHQMMKEIEPFSERITNYYEEKTKKLIKKKVNDFYPF